MIAPEKPWYEELSFKQNPFSIKPSQLFTIRGREEVISAVIDQIGNGSICVVHGDFGSGKTSFLKSIIDAFKGKKQVIYFSCNRLVSDLDIDKLLYERRLMTKVLKIKSKNMILLLDEAEPLSEADYKKIKLYFEKGYLKSVLLVTHAKDELAMPAAFRTLVGKNTFSFDEIPEEHAVNIIRDRIGPSDILTDDIILRIYRRDKRIRHFLKNCDVFMRHIVKNKKKASVSDVDKILEVHRV